MDRIQATPLDIHYFRLVEAFREDVHADEDPEGEFKCLFHASQAVLHDDPKFHEAWEEITEDTNLSHRDRMFEGYGLILKHLVMRGHLNWAPQQEHEGNGRLEAYLG